MNTHPSLPSHASPRLSGPDGYRVHLYGVVRVSMFVPGARSHIDAIAKAESTPGLDLWFQHGDFADEIVAALVDEVGDDGFRRSRNYIPTVDNTVGWIPDTHLVTVTERSRRHQDACDFLAELLTSVESLSVIGNEHGCVTLSSLVYLVQAILINGQVDVPVTDPSLISIIGTLPSASRWIRYMQLIA
ncbi:hypothetical protein EFP19_30765 (plasmid) [Burkholderia glumae]|nr:hypothetical protein EFP19_30765 [Burkholderia glumae]